MLIVTFKRSLLLSAVLLLTVLAGTAGQASASIKTGIYDIFAFPNPNSRPTALDRTKDAGSNLAKFLVRWREAVPSGQPANPQNPNDPAYDWSRIDAVVTAANNRGLEPVLTVFQAPNWAAGQELPKNGYPGVNEVKAPMFHDFAVALATKYKDDVRYYEVWNEPNLPHFFTPQIKAGKFVSPARYRGLLNAFATGIHSADPSSMVIGGNTAPFGHPPPNGQSIGPKPFLKKVVSAKVHFDAWSTHPYTYGGPTHHANKDSDVSLGDMGELRSILKKARRSGKILGANKPQLWASEFSWDSKPPDSRGVGMTLLSRWISETVYRLNKAGVSALVWFGQRDRPFGNIQTQSGFWFCGTVDLSDDGTATNKCGDMNSFDISQDVRKEQIFKSFRFPFVAFAGHGKVKIWGKRPAGSQGSGSIQIWRKRPSGSWKKVTTFNPGASFSKTYKTSWTRGFYKAVIQRPNPNPNIESVPFSLKKVKDKRVLPFGCLSAPTCSPDGT